MLYSPAYALSQQAAASASLNSPARDASALNAISSAMQALGGTSSFAAVKDMTVSGTCVGQNTDGSPASNNFQWIIAGREFIYENTSSSGKSTMGSGHGKPWTQDAQNSARSLVRSAASEQRAYFAPGLLLLHSVADSTVNLKLIGLEQLNGSPALHIQTVQTYSGLIMPRTQEDWYFDPISHLPVQYGFILTAQQGENYLLHVQVQYKSFQTAGSLIEPAQFTFSFEGVAQPSTCSITQVSTDTAPISAMFDAPSGGQQ